VKKKKFILFPLLALLLSSCLFDTDDEGLSNWLSDQGMPSDYKVQTVSVSNLKPVSAKVYRDTLPVNARVTGTLGARSGVLHDLVLDFGIDSAFLARIKSADSSRSILSLYLVDSYYRSDYLPSSILPIEEDIKLNVSWILSDKLSNSELDDLEDIKDSVWFHELMSWKAKKVADTIVSVSIGKTDTLHLTLELPNALSEDIRKQSGNRRLQLRLSAPEASNVFRVYGPWHSVYFPRFRLEAMNDDTTYKYATYIPFHAASIAETQEKCADCLVLHGGGYDSLEVEFPSKPILKALSDFYGDEFPYTKGDSNDVRQAVVMAQMTFPRDDSEGESELGLPIQVVAASFLDSADEVVCRREYYKLDKPRILESGHPNMVFYEGDSLSLQVTYGMRDFINRASDGRNFKMMMRLGVPVLLDKDTVFTDRIDSDGDTVRVSFQQFDYARYDFSSIKSKPATLKLWLASKRGGKTDKKETVKKDSAASTKTEGKKVATSTAREGK
jgi:hypothetical protein